MTRAHTGKSFSDPKLERAHRRAPAAELLDRALGATSTCHARTATELGISDTLLRKYRQAEADIDLRDVMGLRTIAPDAYRRIVSELAELAGLEVVERMDARTFTDQLAQFQRVAKETGEATGALAATVGTTCREKRLQAIRELDDAIAAQQAARLALQREEAAHVATLSNARGVA